MKKSISLLFSIGLGAIVLSGCGGSDGTLVDKSVGYYKGSAIVGVNYQCGSFKDKTKEGGEFLFQSGSGCTFSIGDLKLKEVKPSELSDGVEIKENNAKVIALLMTLDKDGDDELKITPDAIKVLKQEGIKKLDEITDDKLEKLADNLNTTPASIAEAKKHIKNSKLLALLGGKTFYSVDVEDKDLATLKFNDTVTSVNVSDDEGSEDVNISLDGNKIIVNDDEYTIFVAQTENYLLFKDYESDEYIGKSRFYFSKSKALTYINASNSGASGSSGGSGMSGTAN